MDQADRIKQLEERVDRLEGALAAHAALLAIRGAVQFSDEIPPVGTPQGLGSWEFHVFKHQLIELQNHKPAAVASAKAAGFEMVERQITEAMHYATPRDDDE